MVEIHDLHVRFHGASREAGSWARAAAARP